MVSGGCGIRWVWYQVGVVLCGVWSDCLFITLTAMYVPFRILNCCICGLCVCYEGINRDKEMNMECEGQLCPKVLGVHWALRSWECTGL